MHKMNTSNNIKNKNSIRIKLRLIDKLQLTNFNMKKFRQWVPSQSGLNMKMAGKGVCIGARTCETKQRSTSTERLIKHLRVSRQLDEKGCD